MRQCGKQAGHFILYLIQTYYDVTAHQNESWQSRADLNERAAKATNVM
jgi:hypothetical protein